MTTVVIYRQNRAELEEITAHLQGCDREFRPALSMRVDIEQYATKLEARAERLEAWVGEVLIGLLAVYCNDDTHRTAYISSVSVQSEWRGCGIATTLVRDCIAFCARRGMRRIGLEVSGAQSAAIHVYEKSGFSRGVVAGANLNMHLDLEDAPRHDRPA